MTNNIKEALYIVLSERNNGNLMMQREEIDTLQAIYSRDGELEILFQDETTCVISLKINLNSENLYKHSSNKHGKKFTITLELPEGYPHVVPNISVDCNLFTRQTQTRLLADIRSYALTLLGSPMVMDLVLWLQENGLCYVSEEKDVTLSQESEETWTTLLSLDHMRSKTKYVKTLKYWAGELGLLNVIIFYRRWIFLLLQGKQKLVKEFVTRLRTVRVDVDSAGQSCKERMLTVLYERVTEHSLGSREFMVHESDEENSLEGLFEDLNVVSLFNNIIKPIISLVSQPLKSHLRNEILVRSLPSDLRDLDQIN
ncbi:RWD domain-containing protein 3-like isoform X2 [Tachypleus tridentatus]|uniref:RWD domain-containing protein 3-like isoform X2 n=1 Tax=Tachypleus tridentatus TaxID=6853 RepID=UPI003FD4CAED